MHPLHRIHLGNAWEPPATDAGPGVRTAWRRRFGRPSGLGVGTAVWLVIERPTACSLVLNGRPLPPPTAGCDYRHEVGGQIGPRNELLLSPAVTGAADARPPAGAGRLPLPAVCGGVWLEIDESAE